MSIVGYVKQSVANDVELLRDSSHADSLVYGEARPITEAQSWIDHSEFFNTLSYYRYRPVLPCYHSLSTSRNVSSLHLA